MKLRQMIGLNMLKLDLGNGQNITFHPDWVKTLRNLPLSSYTAFMRDTIYPTLIAPDRRSWQRSQINNKDLQTAVKEYKETPISSESKPRGRPPKSSNSDQD